jgi:exocyst complex protein 7
VTIVSYMRNNLTATSETASMLGSGGQGVLDRGIRDARARYMDVWQELLGLLAESSNTGAVARLTGASGDKQVVKDSLSNFFARLDELEALSRQHPLSRQDPDLRDRLSQDVRKLVTPAFSAYAARHAKRVEKCECRVPVPLTARISSHYCYRCPLVSSRRGEPHNDDDCVAMMYRSAQPDG